MAAYKADNYSDPFPSHPSPHLHIRHFKFTVSTALALNDTIKLTPILALSGLVLDGYYIDLPDLDTGGTPALALHLGDNTTAAKFVSASTKGRSPGVLTPSVDGVAGAIPASYTSDNDLLMTVSAGPATGATDVVIKGWMAYHYPAVAITL